MDLPFLPPGLELERVCEDGPGLVVHVRASGNEAACPACGRPSRSTHGRYARAPADLALAGRAVTLRLLVRRYRCRNPGCPRITFAEASCGLVARFPQRTERLREAQAAVGLALGGEAGARLLEKLHEPTSPDTLLRLVRALPTAPPDTPRVLGVDDFCFRRGRTYGTLLVDLERHRVVDVLGERTSEALAAWLRAHPGVEVISRDRSQIYAQGASDGAPSAVQVADRWHLLKNLGLAVEGWLRRHGKHLKCPVERASSPEPDDDAISPGSAPATTGPAAQAEGRRLPKRRRRGVGKNSYLRARLERQGRRSKKLELYERASELRDKGYGTRSVARQLGVARSTIQDWFGGPGFPTRRAQAQGRVFEGHLEYISARLEEPELSTMQLHWELLERGYAGSLTGLYALVATLRAGLPPTPDSGSPVQRLVRYSPREAVWMFVREPARLGAQEAERLARLEKDVPEARSLYEVVQGFARLLRERTDEAPSRLAAWLEAARGCAIPEIKRFVKGVLQDEAAVLAAMTSPWSNGQVEGQVTRLKLLKRQGYGRAKFDLLRARVLLA